MYRGVERMVAAEREIRDNRNGFKLYQQLVHIARFEADVCRNFIQNKPHATIFLKA